MSLALFRSLPVSVVQVSLAAVFACGQSFRWTVIPLGSEEPPTHEYRLCLRDRVVCLRQTPEHLYYRAVYPDPQPTHDQVSTREKETVAWIRDYFQLDVDLTLLYQDWSTRDHHFATLQDRFGGIRILRQDPWENLISFVCSSNNNISRITKMVNSLCKEFSPPLLTLESPVADEKHAYHPFPPPSVLAVPEVSAKLRSLGFGYRAEFIQRTAQMLMEAHGTTSKPDAVREPGEIWLESLRKLTTQEARDELLKFHGVGRKVADCALLMSLDKKEVVPIDTHVYQLAVKYYGVKAPSKGKATMSNKIYDEVSAKLHSIWGEYAGWAHSVMFTSDLKSFSSYGLPTPSSSVSISTEEIIKEAVTDTLTKRKRLSDDTIDKTPRIAPQPAVSTTHDLVDTIKKRRRVVRVRA
ncbi:DNA glycosylase [Amanita muscaria]